MKIIKTLSPLCLLGIFLASFETHGMLLSRARHLFRIVVAASHTPRALMSTMHGQWERFIFHGTKTEGSVSESVIRVACRDGSRLHCGWSTKYPAGFALNGHSIVPYCVNDHFSRWHPYIRVKESWIDTDGNIKVEAVINTHGCVIERSADTVAIHDSKGAYSYDYHYHFSDIAKLIRLVETEVAEGQTVGSLR